ncbi:MAG TPA: TRAP transporter fused permease subunit [Gammaproteobacteria bacterium]|nr:TRAP transporter fused permease subunit [Gammaproteobacteria bacterium]
MSENTTIPDEQLDNQLEEMIAESDTGGRHPTNPTSIKVLFLVPLAWTLFQLWIASPLPYIVNFGLFNGNETRAIHLAFAVFLAYTAFPTFKSSPRDYIPIQDWAAAFVAAFCAAYLFLFANQLADRPGNPTTIDLVVAVAGMVLLLEATRRVLGPALLLVATVILIYTFAGPYMPDVIAHKGASLSKAMSHFWLGSEGVFGVALSVSTDTVFLFVLFGALLERAGAGNYFIKVAFSLLGHMKGGPAKAAVVSSALTGLISGSSIANVVTTGTFTIPLMKRVGFAPTKAAAVEVASSTNGQLMPPIMGAAAFLMVEYVGVSFAEVVRAAFLPAFVSYVALVYIVHLEAMKADLKGLPRRITTAQLLLSLATIILGVIVIAFIMSYGLNFLKATMGDNWLYGAGVVALIAYFYLLFVASRVPPLDHPDKEMTELPLPGPTAKSGLYFLLPILVLVGCMVEKLSAGIAAFWATIAMMAIIVTHRPLLAIMRSQGQTGSAATEGFNDLSDGMVAGARNMITIGVATAAAGIVVGGVTLTGIGQVMTEFVEFVSGGNLLIMLLFTALISLLLGLGLPTTANYIVVSTLMAPVIVTLGAQSGLVVPLLAVHMFVFYFGILADDTPPVGLAAYAGAAIAKSDPVKTGLQGFVYDIRTAILPFMFIFNTELLMIGVNSLWHMALVWCATIAGMLTFSAATQGYMLTKNRLWETALMVLLAFVFMQPGYFMEKIAPQYEVLPASDIYKVAEAIPENGELRMITRGENLVDGKIITQTVLLPLKGKGSGKERLEQAGLVLGSEDGKVVVDDLAFGTPAEKLGLGGKDKSLGTKVDLGWEILDVYHPTNAPAKHWIYLPAILLMWMIITLQRRRRSRAEELSINPA